MASSNLSEEIDYQNLEVCLLEKKLIQEVAELLTVSLFSNEAYSYVFMNKINKKKKMKHLFMYLLRYFSNQNTTYLIKLNSKVIGTFTCASSILLERKLSNLIRSGILNLVFWLNIFELKRLVEISNKNINLIKNSAKGFSFWHFGLLAIKPEFQKLGIARKILSIFFIKSIMIL